MLQIIFLNLNWVSNLFQVPILTNMSFFYKVFIDILNIKFFIQVLKGKNNFNTVLNNNVAKEIDLKLMITKLENNLVLFPQNINIILLTKKKN